MPFAVFFANVFEPIPLGGGGVKRGQLGGGGVKRGQFIKKCSSFSIWFLHR